MWRSSGAHVGPRHEVIGGLVESHDDGVFNNIIGQLHIERVLDEVKRRLAPGRLPPHLDVGLEVRDDSICTVGCLLVHGVEIRVHV